MRFAEFEVTAAGDLLREGAPIHLQPQPLKVLAYLVSHAGELVTRDELRRHIWGEETFVDFDQSLNWCIRRIREVLGDDAGAPRFIQTVPRRGYRFIAAAVPAATVAAATPVRRRSLQPLLAAFVLALLTGSFALTATRPATVLVLPFDDLGGAAQAGSVATHELIHALAKTRVGVIDPLTARKFKNSGECILELGRQLDAQYVLLGAVRRAGAGVRVTAQLFRVADNTQAWVGEQDLDAGADLASVYARMAGEISSKTQRSSID